MISAEGSRASRADDASPVPLWRLLQAVAACLHAVRAGMGIGFLPAWLVEDDLAQGQLERVLPQWNALTVTLYAIYTSRRYLAPKVRSFIDWVSQEFGAGFGDSAEKKE